MDQRSDWAKRPASQLRADYVPRVRRKRADEVYEYEIESLKSELI